MKILKDRVDEEYILEIILSESECISILAGELMALENNLFNMPFCISVRLGEDNEE